MIKVNIKLVNNSDDSIIASVYKEFKNIDELIRFCTSRSNYKYTCTYDLVKGD